MTVSRRLCAFRKFLACLKEWTASRNPDIPGLALLNRFTPGQALPPGSFYVVEQATGFVESMDATQHLNDAGYWGSYNVPYFPRVYKSSGYNEKVKEEGNEFSYAECARAKIFKEQQVRPLRMRLWPRKRCLLANEIEL